MITVKEIKQKKEKRKKRGIPKPDSADLRPSRQKSLCQETHPKFEFLIGHLDTRTSEKPATPMAIKISGFSDLKIERFWKGLWIEGEGRCDSGEVWRLNRRRKNFVGVLAKSVTFLTGFGVCQTLWNQHQSIALNKKNQLM